MDMVPRLSGLTIKSQRVPADGTWDFKIVRGLDVVVIDFNANRKMLVNTLYR